MQWRGARVLVTGGAGFLGGYLVQRIRNLGAEVFAPRSSEYDLVQGDDVRALMSEVRPKLVVHLAAQVGGIGANQRNAAKFFYDNAMMGLQVLHESWCAGVEKFVAAATICAYPKLTPVPFREEDLWGGYPEETNAPYGIAKKVLTVQSQAYRDQYGFNSAVAYPVNLYGPRDNFDLESSHVVPAMLCKFHEARVLGVPEVVLWGDGTPTREFLYVDDCAEALVRVVDHYDCSDPINIGSGKEISMRDLAERVRALVGYEGSIAWDASRPNGQPRRRLDVSRAREILGFEARTSLDEGLRRTYEWWTRS